MGSTARRRARRVTVAALLAAATLAALSWGVPAGSGAPSKASGASGLPRTAAPSEPTSFHLVVGTAADVATGGYWLVASNGGVFAFGAPFYGSAGAIPLASAVVGMAATPDGGGYWLVASDGGVFSFGDARFFGSMGAGPLDRPIVGMAAAPDGGGYWLVASDGGVFAIGDARFFGSMGARPLDRPVVGMAATPDGGGYWFAASDGGVFAFGDARFFGSMGARPLDRPVVGMAATPGGGGYLLSASDGGVFAFAAPFEGSAVGHLQRAAVGLDGTSGSGYRIVSADGGVYAYGSATFQGAVHVPPLVGEVVAIDPGHDGGNGAEPGFIGQPIDGGGLIEPCDTVGTVTADSYPEHAFNFDVGTRLEALLGAAGATVVMTRTTDDGVGPCVNVRAAIANAAGADAAISIHADGGPPAGRGFDVIEPAPVVSSISNNTAIVPASAQLAADVRTGFATDTGELVSDYAGAGGIDVRSDLGGLNLSTVPKVLIECANMQNPTDGGLTESPPWRQQAAQGLADGLTAFLVARQVP